MFLAPCGHEGIPVTVNYVTCAACDSVKAPVPTVGVRTFIIHLFDTMQSVHCIRNVKISEAPQGVHYGSCPRKRLPPTDLPFRLMR